VTRRGALRTALEAFDALDAAIAALESSGCVKAGSPVFMPSRHTKVVGGMRPFASSARSSSVVATRAAPSASVNFHSTDPTFAFNRSTGRSTSTPRSLHNLPGRAPRIASETGAPLRRRHSMNSTPRQSVSPSRPRVFERARNVLTWGLGAVLDLAAPRGCTACDAAVRGRVAMCRSCASTVVRLEEEGPVRAFAEHGAALATALHRLKYRARPDLARPLGDLLATIAPRGAVDLVVPVPLHPSKLVTRGYNQSALLAARVARAIGATYAPLELRRVHTGDAQAGLRRRQRLDNRSLLFEATCARRIASTRVLLVDDVVTTGSTLEACARGLRAAGVRQVAAVALTRSLRGSAPSATLAPSDDGHVIAEPLEPSRLVEAVRALDVGPLERR
jgi:ComF family protein